MEDIDGDNGVEGYLYEPERADFPNIQNNLTDDDSSSDNEGECLGIFRDWRTKMEPSTWCKCGHCLWQKTNNECFCCKEHELITGKLDGLDCITTKSGLDQYVVHRPSLEMAFIDAMIKKHLRKTVPQLTSRPAPRGWVTRVVHGSDHIYQRGDVSDMLELREDGGLQIVY